MIEQTDPKKLKQYLKYAFELESSVYRQKEAIHAANSTLRLEEPKKEYIREPVKPVNKEPNIAKPKYLGWSEEAMEKYIRHKTNINNTKDLVKGIIVLIASICAIIYLLYDFHFLLLVLAVLWGVSAFVFLTSLTSTENLERYITYEKNEIAAYNKKINDANKKYLEQLKAYNKALESYKKAKLVAEEEYDTRLAMAQNNYDVAKNAIVQMEAPLTGTKQALAKLYSVDWIHPKYRNMVAMCTIYEYFDTGRCTTLTGPDGAYNLYEAELRQNLIINKLDSIISQLEAIKSNQYVLYCELAETNKMVKRIASGVDDIVKTTHAIVDSAETTAACAQITASCAQTTAKNTEALKYIALISA